MRTGAAQLEYNRRWRKNNRTKIRAARAKPAVDKVCFSCKVFTPKEDFYMRKAGQDCYCKPCANRRMAQQYQSKKHVWKDRSLKSNYGISLAEYTFMLDAQCGQCAICGDNGNGRALCVDHNHETGAVRQLLCINCNQLIGRAKENPEVLTAAKLYLVRHRVTSTPI